MALIDLLFKNGYTHCTLIGEGTFGCVYSAQKFTTKGTHTFAVKLLEIGNFFHLHRISLEIFFQKRYGVLDSVFDCKTHIGIQMPLADCSLADYKQVPTIKQVLHWFLDLFLCLEKMHCEGVFHLDLKPANLLLFEKGQKLRVMDFGISDFCNCVQDPEEVVTIGYRSPEHLLEKKGWYSEYVDLWAAGLILLECLLWNKQGFRKSMHRFFPWEKGAEKMYQDVKKRFETAKNGDDILVAFLPTWTLDPRKTVTETDLDFLKHLLFHLLRWDKKDRFTATQAVSQLQTHLKQIPLPVSSLVCGGVKTISTRNKIWCLFQESRFQTFAPFVTEIVWTYHAKQPSGSKRRALLFSLLLIYGYDAYSILCNHENGFKNSTQAKQLLKECLVEFFSLV